MIKFRTTKDRKDSLLRRRLNLMKENPYCYWCGKKLNLYAFTTSKEVPHDYPTIDHLNSKESSLSNRPLLGKRVLSCRSCNESRALALTKKNLKNKLIQKWRSGSFKPPFRWLGKLLKWYRKQPRR